MTHPRLFDISPVIDDTLAVFPGDTPPTREVLLDMARGDNLTLSTLRSTVHVGAHVDAPSHYGVDAPTMEQVDPHRFIGPCRVVSVDVTPGDHVPASALPTDLDEERVVLRTGSYPDPTSFHQGFAALSPDFVHAAAELGVRLVGVDTPSVDLPTSKDLPAHHACLERDVLILEGLMLGEVPDGLYELIALPLRLKGFDGSPVRAVLRTL